MLSYYVLFQIPTILLLTVVWRRIDHVLSNYKQDFNPNIFEFVIVSIFN